jgi:ATP-dependent RNA helicase DeaD
MSLTEYAHLLRPELLTTIERKGFTDLTAVQRVVLDPQLAARDLRITSQTGSGKTLAIGLTLRSLPLADAAAPHGVAKPRALVLAPTRELAQQIERELSWLYADSGVTVASATGGASYRTEQRAFARGPGIVVGTPGRLLDHLSRGSIDPSQVGALVLDEADRMLDLGFREDLETIFGRMPAERMTHLASATFPRALRSLADRVQRDPAHVEGSVLGAANADIDHVLHIVDPAERGDAIVNLLLAHPEDQTLIFVRTRADAAELSSMLVRGGFAASGLSGDMEQAARSRALAAFRQGGLRVMVATDVAARGIDVQDVTRVIHAELPRDPDAYTHRSGRTGRAGRKGVSALLVAPAQVVHATRLLRGLGAAHRFLPIPTPEMITQAQDDRVLAQLTAAEEPNPEPDVERYLPLAARLIASGEVERTLARLLALKQTGTAQPRQVRAFNERPEKPRAPFGRADKGRPFPERGERRAFNDRPGRPQQDRPSGRRESANGGRGTGDRPAFNDRSESNGSAREFVQFRVTWGKQRGADARRLLAMICRRGQIQGRDVGAIRVDRHASTVGVDRSVADTFERMASQPDPQEPSVQIRRDVVRSVGAGDEGQVQEAGLSKLPRDVQERPRRKARAN